MKQVRPNCRGLRHVFYGPFESGPGTYSQEGDNNDIGRDFREMYAKSLCAVCPLVEPCREFAIINQEEWGVWGGLTEGERREFGKWCREWGYDPATRQPELDLLLDWFWNDRYGVGFAILNGYDRQSETISSDRAEVRALSNSVPRASKRTAKGEKARAQG